MKNVIVYRTDLLPYSETFIPSQIESYSSYQGFYVGVDRFRGNRYPLPSERTIILSDQAKVTANRKTLFLLANLGYSGWYRSLSKLSACLIHAHFGTDGVWAIPLKKELNIPLIVTFYGYDITVNSWDLANRGFLHAVYLWRRKKLFKEAFYCIAISDFLKNKLIENGCPPDKVLLNYVGVDLDKFSPNPKVSCEPIVLFVGRLVEKKGCKYLIQAMAGVQSIHPEVELVIIGDGPLRKELEQQARNSLKRYRFLGVQSPEQVKTWMNKALLLCTPSITDSTGNAEGLPFVVLEAQAMGLPVVGSIHAGIPEAVLHEETGFLTPEKDWESVTNYILKLATDMELQQKFSTAARERVEHKFSLKKNTLQLEAIYDEVLDKVKQ